MCEDGICLCGTCVQLQLANAASGKAGDTWRVKMDGWTMHACDGRARRARRAAQRRGVDLNPANVCAAVLANAWRSGGADCVFVNDNIWQ